MKSFVIGLVSFLIISSVSSQTFDVEEQQILMPCTTGIWQVFDSAGNMLASGIYKPGYTAPTTCYTGVPYSVRFNSTICSPITVSVVVNDPPSFTTCSCNSVVNVQVVYYADLKNPIGSCTKTLMLVQ